MVCIINGSRPEFIRPITKFILQTINKGYASLSIMPP